MKGLLITIVFVIFIVNYSKSQVEIPISADGVVKYSFDYSVKDSKFCISKLFSLDNQSEYSILLQKCATISSLMSWNEGISNNISVYSVILPGCKKNYIKCEDTIVLSPGSSSFSFSNKKPFFKLKIKGDEVTNFGMQLNMKIFFKNKTDYSIIVSDVYLTYGVMQKHTVIAKRAELSELYNDKIVNSKEDKNRLFVIELLDNAVKNAANTISQAVEESVIFLN